MVCSNKLLRFYSISYADGGQAPRSQQLGDNIRFEIRDVLPQSPFSFAEGL